MNKLNRDKEIATLKREKAYNSLIKGKKTLNEIIIMANPDKNIQKLKLFKLLKIYTKNIYSAKIIMIKMLTILRVFFTNKGIESINLYWLLKQSNSCRYLALLYSFDNTKA